MSLRTDIAFIVGEILSQLYIALYGIEFETNADGALLELVIVSAFFSIVPAVIVCHMQKPLTLKVFMQRSIETFLNLVCGTFAFHLIAILFGAPIIVDADRTALWAALMAVHVFSCAPWLLRRGLRPPQWRVYVTAGAGNGIAASDDAQDRSTLVYCRIIAAGAVFGAWLGAFVIPLDWDRWWQKWPLSSTFGACTGRLISMPIAMYFARQKLARKKLE